MLENVGVVTPHKITEVKFVEKHLTTTISAKSQKQFILLIFNCLLNFNVWLFSFFDWADFKYSHTAKIFMIYAEGVYLLLQAATNVSNVVSS